MTIARITILAIVAAALFLTVRPPVGAAPAPNIIFIMVDDLGYSDTGVYGSRHIHPPNIDRMAADGIRFTQAYAGNTVCAPSRSTLLSGTHMGRTPVRSNTGGVSLRADDVTIAELPERDHRPGHDAGEISGGNPVGRACRGSRSRHRSGGSDRAPTGGGLREAPLLSDSTRAEVCGIRHGPSTPSCDQGNAGTAGQMG